MSCGCIDEVPFCITRGATFTLDVGLTLAWQEVFDDPEAFEARLVLKDDLDTGPIRLTLMAVPQTDTIQPPASPAQPMIYFHFAADPVETLALPDWNLVGYAELRALASSEVYRLFNSRISVEN